MVSASAGATPFGFAFDWRGYLLVSEAFGGAPGASAVSSYRFDDWTPATPITLSPSVGTTQTAACWVVVTPSGRYAYTTNTGSGTVSRYNVQRSGVITLGEAVAATSGAGPIDAAVSATGNRLHVLNAGSHAITSFSIAKDGRLACWAAQAMCPQAVPDWQPTEPSASCPRVVCLRPPGGSKNSKRVPRISSERTCTALHAGPGCA